jgi:Tol biopolymer transport system component
MVNGELGQDIYLYDVETGETSVVVSGSDNQHVIDFSGGRILLKS